jgi:hypothetical protein
VVRYDAAMRGHARFVRGKTIRGFEAPNATWAVDSLRVRVNPELGLRINDQRYIVKLYFRAEVLSRSRVQALVALMEDVLRREVPPAVTFGILDIANADLRVADARSSITDTWIALQSEARAFIEIWNRL